jgi:hypothetical protein
MTARTRILGGEIGPLGVWVIAAMVWAWCVAKLFG